MTPDWFLTVTWLTELVEAPADRIPEWVAYLGTVSLLLLATYVLLWALYSFTLVVRWLLWERRHGRYRPLYGFTLVVRWLLSVGRLRFWLWRRDRPCKPGPPPSRPPTVTR